MIKKYRFGNPIPTDSVVIDIAPETAPITIFEADLSERRLRYHLDKKDVVYGLGETIRGINKRGWTYDSWNSDDPNHSEDKHSLYASQNFLIIASCNENAKAKKPIGIYVDDPGRVIFDIGYTDIDVFDILFEDFDADVYVIEGESILDIVKQFRHIIGKSYIPPKWAFGFGQCRWSYMTADEIREVVREYKKAGIPLDSVYLDIDYMDHYKDFTINEEAFPDFENFVKEMKDEGIHLVPIIDAGVKVEDGYDIYEEGMKKDYFCKKENGEVLTAAVWPGRSHFPDFLNDDARRWFGDKYKILLDMGIEGFWNDMNEPAIFYTTDHLAEVFDKIDSYKGKNLDIQSFFEFKGTVASIDNNIEDYKRFYHDYKGQKVRHDKVHNIFGYNMTRAAGEAFERICPDKRILMFSRSSYIGAHRYGGVWCGDNLSWWSHILLNLQQMPGLNMSGFVFSGADVGGFGADATEDLVMRWTQLAIFLPLFRNHSAMGTRRQEYYRFKDIQGFKNLVDLRYALIPYIYDTFMNAVENDAMYAMPLSFIYENDERAWNVYDQLFIGDSIMIAPVYTQNAEGRYVYLPEDMKMIRFRSTEDYDEEVLEKGDHYIQTGLNEVAIFIRKGHKLPLAQPAMRVADIDEKNIKEISYLA